jgi:spore photoproduct lyase
MNRFPIRHIYIDQAISRHSFTLKILQNLKAIPVTIIPEGGSLPSEELHVRSAKKILYLTQHKGNFCKPCPGTDRSYLCCNYFVINEITGCPLDCRYCILQDYLDTPMLRIYINYDRIFHEYDQLQQKYPHRIFRIGTGELADSLALEPVTGLSSLIVPYFAQKRNTLFELKTKTSILPFLSRYRNTGNIVLSWSLNPEFVIRKHEQGAAPLEERLRAAQKAAEQGFLLSFHIDPVIHHEGWERNYSDLIDCLFRYADPEKIVWISMGALRFTQGLKELIGERYPESLLIRDEQITGMDQKIRYFKPLRAGMFEVIYRCIRHYSGEVFVYFCMEDKKIWEKTMGFSPINSNHLDYLFAKSLFQRFPELNFTEPDYDYYQSFHIKHDPEVQKSL